MHKIVVYHTAPLWFVKNEYFMAKIDVCRSLLPSDRVIGWDIKITSYPNSNASFINIWDRLIWRRSPNLTRSSKLAAAPNCSFANEVQATTVTNMICIHNKTLSPIITVTALISSATEKMFGYALVRWCWEILYTPTFSFCTHSSAFPAS